MPNDDNASSLISLLNKSVSLYGEKLAIMGRSFSCSYREFDNCVSHFSLSLKKHGAKNGEFIGICLERSTEMVIGIYGILKIGAAYVPSDPGNPPTRIKESFQEAGIKLVVTTSNLAGFITDLGFTPVIPLINTDDIKEREDEVISSDNNAYVLYTSGSTGKPKGVMVGHNSVVNLIEYIQKTYPLSQGDIVMLKSPYTFDGSVWELFGWIIMGGTLFITEPGEEKDPEKLIEIIDKFKIAFLFFVPTMLGSFLDFFSASGKEYSLNSLKWVSVGGEVLPVSLVEQFYNLIGDKGAKLINVYGPTETTVYASTYLCEPNITLKKIPIGYPVINNQFFILNESMERVPDGEEGEICIGGAGVSKGYLNRPELTSERYIKDIFSGNGLIYKTGDIGKKLKGELYDYIGRRDFQVKLRGLRIEMGEIEYSLSQIREINESIVTFSKDRHGDNCIVAYIKPMVFPDNLDESLFSIVTKEFYHFIYQKLISTLPKYMIPAHMIFCRSFPLTPHGKIDRNALVPLTELYKNQEDETFDPKNETSERVYNIWKKLLGRKGISPKESFFDAGGDSIKAIQIIIALKKVFNYPLSLKELYNHITLPEMCELIHNYRQTLSVEKSKESIIADNSNNLYPVTPVQTEMWTMNNFDPSGVINNIQVEFELEGSLDVPLFLDNLRKTIKSCETFRTAFAYIDGNLTQQILETVDFEIPIIDLTNLADKNRKEEYLNLTEENGKIKFSTSNPPLFSFKMVAFSQNNHRLLLAIHHLIFDGWSLHLFIERLWQVYTNMDIKKPEYHNGNYAIWFLENHLEKYRKKETEFWKKTLKGIPERLFLPLKTNANITESSKFGNRYWWEITEQTSMLIDQKSKEYGITPFVFFIGAFQVVLSAASCQNDIVTGTPYANRNNPEVEGLIGYFTNMLSIRGLLNIDDDIRSFLNQLQNTAIEVFSNSTVSFGEVVKLLKKGFSPGKNPIYQTIFVMQNWPHENNVFPGFTLKQKEIGNNTSKTDLLLNVEKSDDKYICWIEYNTMLFHRSQIKQISDGIDFTIQQILNNPNIGLYNFISKLEPVLNLDQRKSCFIIGSGGLAVKCAEILKEHGFIIKAIVSQDDILTEFAGKLGISLAKDLKNLSKYQTTDYIFSINNSLILSSQVRSLAKVMTINYHDAPLPKYAGMYAPNWAIINGEKTHGVSWHLVIDEIDAGDILSNKYFSTDPADSVFSLNTKCFEAAIESFEELLKNINGNNIVPIPQNLQLRTYYGLGERPQNFGIIDPSMNVNYIDRLINATKYGAFYDNEFSLPLLSVNHEIYTIASATVFKQKTLIEPGTISEINDKPAIVCDGGYIIPSIIYDKNGKEINTRLLLPLGTILPKAYNTPFLKASVFFKEIARFEPFWKRELENVNFINLPGIRSISDSSVAKSTINNDVLSGALALYILCLSDMTIGTIGFIPSDLPEKITGIESFFSEWLPLNISIDYSAPAYSQLQKVIEKIKELRKKGTFTRTLPIRYPSLRDRSLTGTEQIIIISECDSKSRVYNDKEIIINISKKDVSSWVESFIDNITEFSQRPLKDIDLVSSRKFSDITKLINNSVCDQLPFFDVLDQFSIICEKFKTKTAISDGGRLYNYSSFYKDIEELVITLKEKKIGSGSVVAVMIERKYNYFVAIMAVLQCNACFLPLDPTLPAKRNQFFITDSGASLIITDLNNNLHLEETPALNEQATSEDNDKDSTAYIIYTSGTSGNPKGVKISRSALVNFISGAIELYNITENDNVLQFSNLSFDASIEEIFCAFCSGATLFIRTDELLIPRNLIDFTKENNISVWDLPTAFWRQVIQSEVYDNTNILKSLRLVIIGGEAVTNSDIKLWQNRLPLHRLINTYGPTEATVVALAHEIDANHDYSGIIPIGQPLPGTKIYIVNSNRKVVPPGIPGELLISGKSLSVGYLNREEENKTAFVNLVFTDLDYSQKCYRTGDLTEVSENGLIIYKGRIDSQIKIRGYRVEPLEIERQVSLINGIDTCVVVVSHKNETEKSLIAFIKKYNTNINLNDIKAEIASILPHYMVPERIIEIEEIPLTKNGKADTKKLITIALEKAEDGKADKAMPTNDNEQYIYNLWSKILKQECIGIDDDFFELGGHSLKAIQLVSALSNEKGISVPLSSLIQYPTIRMFSEMIFSAGAKSKMQCLVPIRKEGTKPPVFLIHGAGLNVLLYQSLARDLMSDRPIYALQAKGIDGSVELSTSIEEMAMDYIKEIQTVQPQGPYYLLGFSLGGFVAFDMAKKLQNLGFIVSFIGLIDSVASLAKHIQSPLLLVLFKVKVFFTKPFYNSVLILKSIFLGDLSLLKSKYKNSIIKIIYSLRRVGLIKKTPAKVFVKDGVPQFDSTNVKIIMYHSLKNYILTPANLKVYLFKAEKETFYIPDKKDYGWGKFALKGVNVNLMPAEHSKLFFPENSKLFAGMLDKKLDEIENNIQT